MANESQASGQIFTRSYNSFSGVDIKAVLGTQALAEIQAISYAIQREKAPIYTMGSADPRAFSRGKRGIAGTLITVMFDRHVLLHHFGVLKNNSLTDFTGITPFLADVDDIVPDVNMGGRTDVPTLATLSNATASADDTTGQSIAGQESNLTNNIASDQLVAAPWFADQIPPFDITLAGANEYGALAVMRIFGAEILNEGYGVSVDDMVSETQNSYVCRTISGWQAVSAESLNITNADKLPYRAVSEG